MKVLLMIVAVFSIICSPNIYAYDTKYSLHGVRTSFLTGNHQDKNSWKKPGGMSLMYLSDGFHNRAGYRQRLLNNGDTHIDLYARATNQPSGFSDGTISGYGDHRPLLKQLNDSGLKPVIWLTPEKRRGDGGGSVAEESAFIEQYIKKNDDLVAGYVVGLELDEHMSADKVTALVNKAKSLTNKPVGVHLTPGVGGATGNLNYYRNADYIYLQFGDHLTGDFTTDSALAVAMLKQALTVGLPVVANEYSIVSESAGARALGDLLCANGAVGTGNGRSITFCGAEEVRKESNFLKKHEKELIGVAGVSVAIVAVYFYQKHFNEPPLNFTLKGNDNYQTYGANRAFNLFEKNDNSLNFEMELSHTTADDLNENKIFFGFTGTF